MAKTCNHPECDFKVWGKGYCQRHQYLRTDKKPAKEREFKPIRKVSAKLAKDLREYSKERILFLSLPENRFCRVYQHLEATTVHHAKGRIGKLLLDKRWWIPLSLEGHKWAEEHPEEAKRLKLSFSRLAVSE